MSAAARLPRRIQLLVLALAALALTGWFRLWQALAFWTDLTDIALRPGPDYLAVSGAALGMLGALAAWRLARRRPYSANLARLTALVAALWYWAERLLFTRNGGAANLPFSIAITAIALGYTFAALAWWQRRGFHPNLRIENERQRPGS